jgi:glucose-1-phosphate adenylyltransferase
VPLGGKFRLVDVPISNALHAGLRRIFVLTQFNSASLHRHISSTYTFSHLSSGFVDILAASQSLSERTDWYEGTADAVRKTLSHLQGYNVQRVLILSGDQLYRLNFEEVLSEHLERGAEVTVAGNLVPRERIGGMGIMKVDPAGRIVDFVEKPDQPEMVAGFEIPTELYPEGSSPAEKPFAASMGMYVWEIDALREALEEYYGATDFGHEIIPKAVKSYGVYAHLFDGYWEDVGTIRSYYEASLSLVGPDPPFEFYHRGRAIYTHPRYLPPARIRGGAIKDVIIADGADLDECTVHHSVIGVRSVIRKGVEIRDSVIMGADSYPAMRPGDSDGIPIGIGHGTTIRNAIIDKDARIGENVVIEDRDGIEDRDEEHFSVREGIVVVPKNAAIPGKTRIKP